MRKFDESFIMRSKALDIPFLSHNVDMENL
jgi:hypothetical protein